jgi:hypothetical protein
LKNWGKFATKWATENLEGIDKEWDVEPHEAAVWEQYGLAMQLENLGEKIGNCLSREVDEMADISANKLEYFQWAELNCIRCLASPAN